MTIAKQWKEFSNLVMPKDAHPIQVQEMRRAFYAGAHGMMKLVRSSTDLGLTEDEGVDYLNSLVDEITRFYIDLTEGRA